MSDAVQATRRLAASLVDRYRIEGDDLLLFFSGSKGFHIGLATALWSPEPSATFHRVARRFADAAAERAGVAIDSGVYDAVRAFRTPNSRHPKTGLHKRRLTWVEGATAGDRHRLLFSAAANLVAECTLRRAASP